MNYGGGYSGYYGAGNKRNSPYQHQQQRPQQARYQQSPMDQSFDVFAVTPPQKAPHVYRVGHVLPVSHGTQRHAPVVSHGTQRHVPMVHSPGWNVVPNPMRRATQPPPESVDIFADESQSLARALKNGIDPYRTERIEMEYIGRATQQRGPISTGRSRTLEQESVDPFQTQSTSEIRETVSVTMKPRVKKRAESYFEKWRKSGSQGRKDEMTRQMEDDFLTSPRAEKRAQKPKQIRMDEYLFKARRIDKGSRHFGLKTIHEPKRGSLKKRKSIEKLELPPNTTSSTESSQSTVEASSSEFDSENGLETENYPDNENLPMNDELDATIPLVFSNSPVFKRKMNIATNLDATLPLEFSSSPMIFGQKNISAARAETELPYHNKKTKEKPAYMKLLEKYGKTPEKSASIAAILLDETVPLKTPSPAKNRPKKRVLALSQAELNLSVERAKRPIFDFPEEEEEKDDEIIEIVENPKAVLQRPQKQRRILQQEAENRENFGKMIDERAKMMEKLVDEEFLDRCENGAERKKEEARAQMKDGQVYRKKADRKELMHGTSCKCCRGYYDNLDMTPNEKQKFINQVSRHRYVHQPLPDTPEHYWDLTMGPSDEEMVRGTNLEQEWRNLDGKSEDGKESNSNGLANWD